jgi:hypothetical protein
MKIDVPSTFASTARQATSHTNAVTRRRPLVAGCRHGACGGRSGL